MEMQPNKRLNPEEMTFSYHKNRGVYSKYSYKETINTLIKNIGINYH